MFDKRMEECKEFFAITNPEDWQQILPDQVKARPNCGQVFLDFLRLNLANRGLTLLEDQTPAFWQANLSVKRGGMQVSNVDGAVLSDFTVLIDTGEQQPFTFQGFRADADRQRRPLVIKTERRPLGISHGDYSIKGMEGLCHVERKSCQDAIGTVLGFGQHRDNFIKTLTFLAEIPSSCIIVEPNATNAQPSNHGMGRRLSCSVDFLSQSPYC